jgi:phosphoenolpyruvate phosphomutase
MSFAEKFRLLRIEAFIAGWGLDEALKRAYAYEEAGADGLVIHSALKEPSEIYAFAKAFKGKIPLVAIPTTYYHVTADELGNAGYKMVIYANQGLRAAIHAMKQTFQTIAQEGTTRSIETSITTMKEVFELQGMPRMKEEEKKYLKSESVHAIIPAAGEHKAQGDLSGLLKDNPICMLDIAGKPLLSRQTEILQGCGVTDIVVVGGYQGGKIKASGIKDAQCSVDYVC